MRSPAKLANRAQSLTARIDALLATQRTLEHRLATLESQVLAITAQQNTLLTILERANEEPDAATASNDSPGPVRPRA